MVQDTIYLSIYFVAFEKNVHFTAVGRSVLNMLVRSCWLMGATEFFYILETFCLVVLSIIEGKVFQSPSIIVGLSYFAFQFN